MKKCKYCNAENKDGAKFCNMCGAELSDERRCKKCGTLLKENDVFCPQCGERVESIERGSESDFCGGDCGEKIIKCKYCNAENKDGTKFCNMCGAELSDERRCKKCGTLLKENAVFCPQCGEKAENEKGASDKKQKLLSLQKVMSVATLATSVFLAVITIIFTIFMGCKSGMNVTTSASQKINLFYYFDDAWKEISTLPESFDAYNATVYIRIILGLLISVATLVTVMVFSIMSIVRNVTVITKKGDKAGINLSLIAFFAFVAGVTGLFFIHTLSVEIMGYNVPKEVVNELSRLNTRFNGATIAGFVIGGISLALMIVFSLLSDKKRFNARYLLNSGLSVVGIVLMIVLAAMFAKPFATISLTGYYDGYDLSIGYGPFSLFGRSALWIDSGIENAQEIMIFSIIGFIIACAVLVIGLVYISKAIKTIIYNQTNKAQFALSILLVGLSLFSLVCIIVANNYFKDILFEESSLGKDKVSFSFVAPIVIFIMSLLTLGVEIARLITIKKIKG